MGLTTIENEAHTQVEAEFLPVRKDLDDLVLDIFMPAGAAPSLPSYVSQYFSFPFVTLS